MQSLKIQKEKSETASPRKTDNTMPNRKMTNRQTVIHKYNTETKD